MGYLYDSENLNWAAQNFAWAACGPRFGHGWIRVTAVPFQKSVIDNFECIGALGCGVVARFASITIILL